MPIPLEPFGPHAAPLADALSRAVAATQDHWARVGTLAYGTKDRDLQTALGDLALLLGRLGLFRLLEPGQWLYDSDQSVVSDEPAVWVVTGLHCVAVADVLGVEDFLVGTKALRALIGGIRWPTHPLCHPCRCGLPLGAHMAATLGHWGTTKCRKWGPWTENQTDIAIQLLLDRSLTWTEVLEAVPRLA